MKTMKKIITFSFAALLVAVLGMTTCFAGKPGGGGGSKKVAVESATPGTVIQTAEEDVTIRGSGFDNGSKVRFLVTGTIDDSQIEVGPAQFISSTELKVHIKTTGATAAVDYDIEVQAASGRKGKGTTLFKVQQVETACNDSEPKEPVIVFLAADQLEGDMTTNDLYLSSESGCDTYLLQENVQIRIDSSDPGPGQWIATASLLRYAISGNRGFVTWVDDMDGDATTGDPINLIRGISFRFDGQGNISPDSSGSQVLYVPGPGRLVRYADVRFNSTGEVELALVEQDWGGLPTSRQVVVHNVDTQISLAVVSGPCPLMDQFGGCFAPKYHGALWGKGEDAIYFRASNVSGTDDIEGVAGIFMNENGWSEPRMLMEYQGSVTLYDTAMEGFVLFGIHVISTNKRGKRTGTDKVVTMVIDTTNCAFVVCTSVDAVELSIPEIRSHNMALKENGALLARTNQNWSFYIVEFFDPFSGQRSFTLINDAVDFDFGL